LNVRPLPAGNVASYVASIVAGVDVLHADFRDHRYDRHAHPTYAIGVTEGGAQAFRCRGGEHASGPGLVMALNPDDAHDGHAAGADGYRYRMLYVAPELVLDSLRDAGGRPALPLFREPVMADGRLAAAVRRAARALADPDCSALERESGVRGLVETLAGAALGERRPPSPARAEAALRRVRDHLHDRLADDVTTDELARVAGLGRSYLCRVFRARHGTSLHRYQRGLRLRRAAALLAQGQPPALVAAATGFADQSHLTRWLRATYGVSPGAWRTLTSPPARRAAPR
jgi:AraC-like DNA-binding protein